MNRNLLEDAVVELLIVAISSLLFLIVAILEVDSDTSLACRILSGISLFSWCIATCILFKSDYEGSKFIMAISTALSIFIFCVTLFFKHLLFSRYFIILPIGQILLFMSYAAEFARNRRY